MNALTIGIDVAKEFHWVVATVPHPDTGKAHHVLSRRVDNTIGRRARQPRHLLQRHRWKRWDSRGHRRQSMGLRHPWLALQAALPGRTGFTIMAR